MGTGLLGVRSLFVSYTIFIYTFVSLIALRLQIHLTISQMFQSLGVDDKPILAAGNTTSYKNGLQSDDGEKDMTVIWKCTLIIASIYVFYLLNNVMNFCQVSTILDHVRSMHRT